MDVLENNVIGAFIFGLGRQIEARHGRMPLEPIGVELLQQTPLDTTLGDVLVANSRMIRLIEFKRAAGKIAKEKAKLRLLKTALSSPQDAHLCSISRKIHWFVSTNYDKEQASTVVPYLDFDVSSTGIELSAFIENITIDIRGPGMTEEELRDVGQYMRILGEYAGKQSSGGTVGGLLFSVDGRGEANYIFIEDVRELAMSPKLVMEQHVERQRAIEARRIEMAQEATRQSHRPGIGL